VDAGSGRQRNADVSSEMRVATPTSEQYGVFRAYLDARNPDGGMADMTLLDHAMMIEDSYVYTCMVEYRRRCPENGSGRRGDLLAVAFTDVLNEGISMVYSFFQPEEGRRSLRWWSSTYRASARMGLGYVYLGYWVRGSRKMDYKARFLPQERLGPDGWSRVDR
jgi:arginyl-tRNA--protein-N-Asp/Glu arginylyltransferase